MNKGHANHRSPPQETGPSAKPGKRGGSPSAYDRVLASRFGCAAVDLVREKRYGVMVALRSPDIVAVPLQDVVGRTRNVPVDGDVVRTARDLGMCLGD